MQRSREKQQWGMIMWRQLCVWMTAELTKLSKWHFRHWLSDPTKCDSSACIFESLHTSGCDIWLTASLNLFFRPHLHAGSHPSEARFMSVAIEDHFGRYAATGSCYVAHSRSLLLFGWAIWTLLYRYKAHAPFCSSCLYCTILLYKRLPY